MIQFLQILFRSAWNRSLFAALFAVLALTSLTEAGGPSAGAGSGSWQTRRDLPYAALLHQDALELSFRPFSNRERSGFDPLRRAPRPELEAGAALPTVSADRGRLPTVRPGAFHCFLILRTVFPVRAGPVGA